MTGYLAFFFIFRKLVSGCIINSLYGLDGYPTSVFKYPIGYLDFVLYVVSGQLLNSVFALYKKIPAYRILEI